MKTTFSTNGCLVMAAALAIAITSCTDDTIANDETKQTDTPANQHVYTMSVQANKGGADTQTRALSLSDKTLNATWSTTENIYMTDITPRYSTTGTQEPRSSEWATYPLKPQSNGASATLSGTIHGLSISKGDLLRLQFPKKGTMSYEGQKGTLDDIAANYDYAVAYVNVAGLEDVGANTRITPSGTANFVNQQAIVKFKFQDKDGNPLNVTDLTITTDKNMLVQQKTFRDVTIINPRNDSGWTFLTDDSSEGVNSQNPSCLFTENTNDKWCSIESQKKNGQWTARFHSSEHQVDGYAFATGYDNDDFPGRNPKSWVVKASGNMIGYSTIATVTDDKVLEDYRSWWYYFPVEKTARYNSFGLEISESKGAKASYDNQEVNIMQLGKFRLLTFNYNTTYGPLVVTPTTATSELTVALCNDYISAENSFEDNYKLIANTNEATYVCEKSNVTFKKGQYYEITVKMNKVDLSRFSVNSENKTVYFSPGNLFWTNGHWAFHSNSWDYVGNRQNNTSPTSSNDSRLDLFCWGATGLNGVAPNTADSYWTGTDNLSGNNDWGSVDIQNTNLTGWRTLSNAEWEYIIRLRPNADKKIGFATINYYGSLVTKGLVLLPDAWILPDGCSFTPTPGNQNMQSISYDTNTYTSDQWEDMLLAGAVFLPAAGQRSGSTVSGADEPGYDGGYYWTSTAKSVSQGETPEAYYIWFTSAGGINNTTGTEGYRYYTYQRWRGLSVRLVIDAPLVE